MLIQKTSQSITGGFVLNSASSSQNDTYSCNYLNSNFQLKGTILYTGDEFNSVLLSDSSANYSFLEIFFQGASNYNSVKVYSPNGKKAYLTTGWMNTNHSGNFKMAIVQISGNTISKVNYTALNYDTNYANGSEENGISIVCVIGYK